MCIYILYVYTTVLYTYSDIHMYCNILYCFLMVYMYCR